MQKKRRRKSHAWAPLKGREDMPLELGERYGYMVGQARTKGKVRCHTEFFQLSL